MLLRQRMWATIGYLKYHFSVESLRTVIRNMAKVCGYPKGYMYPELHLSAHMPDALLDALTRKPAAEQPKIEEQK